MSTGNGSNQITPRELRLDDIVREWARAQIQKLDIWNYNGAMLSYNHQADMANRLGLTDRQKLGVTPFPCPTNQSVTIGGPHEDQDTSSQDGADAGGVSPPPIPASPTTGNPPVSGKSRWWPAAGAAVLASALTAGSIGGTAYVMAPQQQEEQQQEAEQKKPKPKPDVNQSTGGQVGVDVLGWPKKNQTSRQ